MSTTPYENGAKLDKLDSLMVLEKGYSRGSSCDIANGVKFGNGLTDSKMKDAADGTTDEDGTEEEDAAHVSLDLSIRRGRLALLTAIAVVTITTLTVVFNHGVEVSRIDAKETSTKEQTKILNNYNSYAGNIASAFGKPIEIFVTLAVQVIVLRFMVAAILKPELSWKVGAMTIALSVAVGFLINNGFNALNVQLRPLEIQPAISDADLALVSTTLSTDSLNWTRTTSENTPQNPITNTILREVVTTRVPKSPSLCPWLYGKGPGTGDVPDPTLDLGFTQRDWQAHLLQEALMPKQLTVFVNATNAGAKKNISVADLPMNASLAADLFVYGTQVGQGLFSWNTLVHTTRVNNVSESSATLLGVLPPLSASANETTKRQFFLNRLPAAMSGIVPSQKDLSVQYSHVDISPSLRFDAITFEFEINCLAFGNATTRDQTTRYKTLDTSQSCGPWPALCLVEKRDYMSFDNADHMYYDTPAQVSTFAACINSHGTEEMMSPPSAEVGFTLECNRTSNSSLFVVSVGKRLVADGFWQNKSANATGLFSKNDSVVVKNIRKIYSYTVGRLSWSAEDLSSTFHAACGTTSSTKCRGLRLPLATSSKDATTQQHLVVGVDALPLGLVPKLRGDSFFTMRQRIMPLIKLNEPMRRSEDTGSFFYDKAVGDVLLPHNLQDVQWDMNPLLIATKSMGMCDPAVEDRIYLTLKNHRYMEQSLQPAYTAATFFLFQNGVVKDAVKLGASRTSLNFAANKQELALWVSIPDRNAWLTIGGCIVLVVGLTYVLLLSTCRSSLARGAALGDIKEPHAIARVMMDEKQFPSNLLHRRIVRSAGSEKSLRRLDNFTINGISLQAQEEQARLPDAGK
jgi:hypothetical protein